MAFDSFTSSQQPEGLIALGKFRFSVDKATYNQLQLNAKYQWEEIKRVGEDSSLQFTGKPSPVITISGVLFPRSKKEGYSQLPALRAEAGNGKPLNMVDGLGNALGQWAVISVAETHSSFSGVGLPKKIAFSISLKRYKR